MPIVQIALPIPTRQLFDYLCTENVPAAGCRVRVPFGPRNLIGVVMGEVAESPFIDKLKYVSEQLDNEPVLNQDILTLCQWLAQYYHHPIGEVVHTALPVALRKGVASVAKPIEMLKLVHPNEDEVPSDILKAKKQLALFQLLQKGAKSLSELRLEFSRTVIEGLVDKRIAERFEQAPEQIVNWSASLSVADKPKPNVEQSLAISAITQKLSSFSAFLLEGVTGSGKTEVYLQSIEEVIKAQKQVLILVPEIGLTPQTVQRFEARFGLPVGVLHSNLTDNERLLVWQQSRSAELAIIIGTRSAIFTPLCKPGMIIVDEEHDGSYKQQDGLRYSARDLAIIRAKELGIPVVLGSATPCLETLNNALLGKYRHLNLTHRAGNATLTRQHVQDMTNQPVMSGITAGMLTRMEQHLKAGNQVMLFINRRGFAPALLCHQCGRVETCQRCNTPFTVHRQLNKIQCHHCGAAKSIPHACLGCGSHDLMPQGVGTEQLEQSLKQHFPHFPSVRIDSDSARGKSKLNHLLDSVNKGKYSILIGTQILSKGHHFPNVTLVVILDADGALFSADYRAAEHLAQLITQLSGRAGRADKPGEMWLQTHQPGHPLLQDLIHNGYGHFARFALLERKQAGLPPFSFQVLIRCEALQAQLAFDFLAEAANILSVTGVNVIGPIPALMEKRQGRYRMQLLLQSPSRMLLNQGVGANIHKLEALLLSRKVRWSIDVDPQDFM